MGCPGVNRQVISVVSFTLKLPSVPAVHVLSLVARGFTFTQHHSTHGRILAAETWSLPTSPRPDKPRARSPDHPTSHVITSFASLSVSPRLSPSRGIKRNTRTVKKKKREGTAKQRANSTPTPSFDGQARSLIKPHHPTPPPGGGPPSIVDRSFTVSPGPVDLTSTAGRRRGKNSTDHRSSLFGHQSRGTYGSTSTPPFLSSSLLLPTTIPSTYYWYLSQHDPSSFIFSRSGLLALYSPSYTCVPPRTGYATNINLHRLPDQPTLHLGFSTPAGSQLPTATGALGPSLLP